MLPPALPGASLLTPDWAQPPMTPEDRRRDAFVNRVRPTAQKWSQQTGIPPEVYTAWAASESNYGNAGSIFGIKRDPSQGQSQEYDTWEAGPNGERIPTRASFATYKNDDEAFQHLHNMLGSSPRYKAALDYVKQTGDAGGFLRQINDAGYATDPNWADSIVSMANTIGGGNIQPAPHGAAPVAMPMTSTQGDGWRVDAPVNNYSQYSRALAPGLIRPPDVGDAGLASGLLPAGNMISPPGVDPSVHGFTAGNYGDVPYDAGQSTAPRGGINPNQGGFRSTELTQPASGEYQTVSPLKTLAQAAAPWGIVGDALTPPVVGDALQSAADAVEGTPSLHLLDRLGVHSIAGHELPTAGEVLSAAVPTNVLDAAATLLPGAGEAGDLGRAGVREGAIRAGASATADRLLPKGLLANERRGANVAEALGGTRTQGARVGQEFGPEVAGGSATRNLPAPHPNAVELPEVGDSGIQAALAAKREATQPVAKSLGPEGSLRRKVVGAINPSVDIPQEVHVANQARTAVGASLRTELAQTEVPAYRKLAEVFDAETPKYTGPANRPLKGTWPDYAENPSMYEASPSLTAAKEELRAAQDASISKVRAEYGVDLGRFQGADPEGVYVPHVSAAEQGEKAISSTEKSISSRGSVAKERAYDSLSDRVAKHPEWKPETDPTILADNHAAALANMASNNTFKAGVNGKTLTEVIDEMHPGLRDARDKMAQRVQGIKARIDAAEARTLQADASLGPLIKEQAAIDSRATPKFVAVSEADNLTPELKTMQTQLGELRIRARAIDKAITKAYSKQDAAVLRLNDAQSELGQMSSQLDALRTRYNTAAPGDYVRGPDFRYHTPENAAAIKGVLKQGFDNAFIDGAINAGNTARAVGLGPDFSPLTIQGALGAFSHPEVAMKDGAGLARSFFQSADEFAKSLDPELVKRFEFASNRRVGSLSEEAVGSTRFKLPGQPLKKFNDALQRVVDFGTLKAFENDSNLLMKLGMESQNVADHEAANSLSKIIPRINNAEQGRSVQRVKLEGVLPTSRSFTAQPFALAKDYGSAVAKVATGGELLGREKLALVRGSAMIGSLMTLSVGSAVMSAESNGRDPIEAVKEVMDPSSGRFMHLILGNKGSIGLGGPFRSAALGVFRTITQGPEGAVRYARGRLQPEVGAAYDIAVNRDYKGQPIRTGSGWHQVLQSVEQIAKNANILGGGVAQGAEDNGLSGAVQQGASGALGVNYQERSPYDERDLAARNEYGKPYGQLSPAERDAINQKGITPQGDYQKRKAQVVGEIDQAERTALDAFKAGTNTQKITDIWHDLGTRRMQAAKDLSSQFAEQFKDFDKSKYDKALEGYYAIDKTFADGTPDFDTMDKARTEYIGSLPTDQQKWLKEAQQVSESHKSPERQQYDQYIDAKKKLGYFDIKADDPHANEKRKALDLANPEIDLASWYYSGTSEKAGAGLNTPAAADKALALNLPNRPVKITGYDRPVNESPKVREVYDGTKQLITDYENALVNPQNLENHAQDRYQKKYSALTDSERSAVKSSITRSLQDEHPDLDAVLAFFGKSETLGSPEAVRYLTQMIDHAGIKDPAKDKILSKVKA